MSHRKWIVSFDLGTRTGHAVREPDGGVLDYGEWRFDKSRHYRSPGVRYAMFRSKAEALIESVIYKAGGWQEVIVAYEEVRAHLGTRAAHVYGGMMSQLLVVCEDLGVEYLSVPVGTVKKRATGSGRANKDDMIDAAKRAFDPSIDNDNTADALWVAEAAAEILGF